MNPINLEQVSLTQKSHLIFDFDGTLVDSFDCAIKVFNLLALKHHFQTIEPEDISMLKNMDSKAWLRHFEIPIYKLPVIMYQAAQRIHNEVLTLQPYPGIPQMITQLHEAGYQLSIVSSNSEQNMKAWLEHHHLTLFFHHVVHAPNFYGKSKTLKWLIQEAQHAHDKTCYIGDETRDIEAARQTGIDCMAVTWGFQSDTMLIKYEPQFLAYHPNDILKTFLE